MKIIYNTNKILILFMIIISFFFTACNNRSKESDNSGSNITDKVSKSEAGNNDLPEELVIKITDLENPSFRYTDWDGVLDERGFDPLDFVYPEGQVKEMNVWVLEIGVNNPEKEHILTKIYDSKGRVYIVRTFDHGDESSMNYIYDDFGRLIKIEESYNGDLVPERHLTYKYLPYNSDENKVSREVYKNNELIKVETEQIINNKISLEIDFTDKKATKTDSLYFEKGNNVKYVNDSGPRFKYITKFSYENNTLIKMINLNSKEENMFIHEFRYNEDGNIIEGITHDYRHDSPTIMRTQKAMNHDQHGNWLRKELYEDDIMVGLIEREISYY